ncbi:diadenosine tetraphosphatase ApaH/serine/threonine PP2A family protein phosphatase [Virgibacillus halotolerans]|uniref:bis(5'-nucleosyl)-tetraphosphatase PrpE n=1 Tax=Virgibacillus halotolerans TaxID=1071053 RepID=UPI0019610A1C|nr:bis(5'-nucleosyl)-tetraphosphatase PrpE [Virgibacillus halotolerans]MBM7601614.1 diadenosine tetraphosphatase ApaH/serine/threonine PP2A family protein phosphatase [Virgibacillus halotolerans]
MKVDIIGDVHGCFDELCNLLQQLGYQKKQNSYVHPGGRFPVFLGDITDRGPDSLQTIQLVYNMVVHKQIAYYVPGNHCNKLYRYFLGNKVMHLHGLETTVAEYTALPNREQKEIRHMFMTLYEQAPLYLQLPEVQAVVAHAGIKESLIGRTDKKVESFVLYGDVSGAFHPDGRPIRRDWAQYYQGKDWIVYGHTPVKTPRFVHRTVNIDTGCVFGNALTAFRLPEEKIVNVPSKQPLLEEKFTIYDET